MLQGGQGARAVVCAAARFAGRFEHGAEGTGGRAHDAQLMDAEASAQHVEENERTPALPVPSHDGLTMDLEERSAVVQCGGAAAGARIMRGRSAAHGLETLGKLDPDDRGLRRGQEETRQLFHGALPRLGRQQGRACSVGIIFSASRQTAVLCERLVTL
jgi:hypothetical protein